MVDELLIRLEQRIDLHEALVTHSFRSAQAHRAFKCLARQTLLSTWLE